MVSVTPWPKSQVQAESNFEWEGKEIDEWTEAVKLPKEDALAAMNAQRHAIDKLEVRQATLFGIAYKWGDDGQRAAKRPKQGGDGGAKDVASAKSSVAVSKAFSADPPPPTEGPVDNPTLSDESMAT